MPPMVTDDEGSSVSDQLEDVILPKKSAKASAKTTKKTPTKHADDDMDVAEDDVNPADEEDEAEIAEDDDDDDDQAEDEFVVEKILSHSFEKDGTLKYHIKWLGYPNPQDQTWEPEENLIGAYARLTEYHKKIGGKPVYKPSTPAAAKSRGRGKRKSQGAEPTPDAVASTRAKKQKTNGSATDYDYPIGLWEDHIESIQTIEEHPVTGKDGKENTQLLIFTVWKDGRQRSHTATVVRQKCPQKLLDYLLSKLVFKTNESDQPQEKHTDETGGAQQVVEPEDRFGG